MFFRVIVKRLAQAVPVFLGISILVFFMLSYIPGNAADILALEGGGSVSGEELQKLREQLGINDPVWQQYWRFFTKAIRGDLGRSIRTNQPVTKMLMENLPSTIQLAATSMVLAVIIGLTLGIIAGIKHGTWVDSGSMVLALLGWSMPQFWLGLVLMLVFSIKLKVLPITGGTEWQRMILPALTLALGFAGIIARLVRTEILEELRKEYVRTARSKGLKESAVLIIHVLRNSMISVVTIIGLQFGRMLGGAVIVESVFARQGVGRMAIDALIDRDMPVVQGAVLFLALVFLLSNLLVDITYSLLDPRIRIQSE
mgnify:CR=1 FL=1